MQRVSECSRCWAAVLNKQFIVVPRSISNESVPVKPTLIRIRDSSEPVFESEYRLF